VTKILTVQQPWAWLIMHGGKNVENRSWRPAGGYRGELVIHAGKTIDDAGVESAEADMRIELPNPMPRGVILGSVDLVDVVQDSDSEWAESGQWHWLLGTNLTILDKPMPWIGKLSLREFTETWRMILEDHASHDVFL